MEGEKFHYINMDLDPGIGSVDMGLSTDEEDCPKQLISMGAYVIIMPDKKWINTMTLEWGSIEESHSTT